MKITGITFLLKATALVVASVIVGQRLLNEPITGLRLAAMLIVIGIHMVLVTSVNIWHGIRVIRDRHSLKDFKPLLMASTISAVVGLGFLFVSGFSPHTPTAWHMAIIVLVSAVIDVARADYIQGKRHDMMFVARD